MNKKWHDDFKTSPVHLRIKMVLKRGKEIIWTIEQTMTPARLNYLIETYHYLNGYGVEVELLS